MAVLQLFTYMYVNYLADGSSSGAETKYWAADISFMKGALSDFIRASLTNCS